ncbi:hypothetical protein BHE74_00042367 [Ensete ventricosum]|nr:hypothetical protein GW17_00012107 [Ensete ventricosum]RWW51294.1 hypothetical protein BHE74_00042367 [Ensete ventricosum]RZR96785.1 hypothetical protein BHM03_00025849 [Ensete ventricosum]
MGPIIASIDNIREEEIVVVGAGIAGLATALSLHRLGVGSVVLEQGESLRAGGTSLTLFKNGWRVLDSIGVADELRPQFLQIQGYDLNPLKMAFFGGKYCFDFDVLLLERRVLLETLASRLPPNTVSFSSRLKSIRKEGNHGSLLELEDGGRIRAKLLDVMQNTPDDSVIKTPLVDRWLWPSLTPSASSNGVVVVGDAWHPMTPNLGQGACCALEDSVVLAKKLAAAIGGGQDSVDAAMQDYSQERWARIFPLTARSNLVGSLLQWDNPLVCAFRNNIMVPKLVSLGSFLEHTNFECEMLEPVASR